jgi:hypothetical protein
VAAAGELRVVVMETPEAVDTAIRERNEGREGWGDGAAGRIVTMLDDQVVS